MHNVLIRIRRCVEKHDSLVAWLICTGAGYKRLLEVLSLMVLGVTWSKLPIESHLDIIALAWQNYSVVDSTQHVLPH
jgi:hypothetical protein